MSNTAVAGTASACSTAPRLIGDDRSDALVRLIAVGVAEANDA